MATWNPPRQGCCKIFGSGLAHWGRLIARHGRCQQLGGNKRPGGFQNGVAGDTGGIQFGLHRRIERSAVDREADLQCGKLLAQLNGGIAHPRAGDANGNMFHALRQVQPHRFHGDGPIHGVFPDGRHKNEIQITEPASGFFVAAPKDFSDGTLLRALLNIMTSAR